MDRIIRTYSELIRIPDFEGRFNYLALHGKVGRDTFGADRIFNQKFYTTSKEWEEVRNYVIARDLGCDLAHSDYEIPNGLVITVHHMNPISMDDLVNHTAYLLDPEYLITTTDLTHKAIHYGDFSLIPKVLPERRPYDTCPWRK